jgi:hypothetical protein
LQGNDRPQRKNPNHQNDPLGVTILRAGHNGYP